MSMKLLGSIAKSTGWFGSASSAQTSTEAIDQSQETRAEQRPQDAEFEAARELLIKDGYNANVESIREAEYPQLKGTTYLDHAGTTIYASSVIRKTSEDLLSNLYGNPHSQSPSSQLTTRRIRDVRLRVLRLFNANPDEYDVVFCANATAGVKLLLETFAGQEEGFDYYYHKDCHTSIIGVREVADHMKCLTTEEVNNWVEEQPAEDSFEYTSRNLFAYPAQSNFSGLRLPLDWAQRVRSSKQGFYTLLDAAALVTTQELDLTAVAPDFTVVSFYKMFGYPDLGALIVRKSSPGVPEFLESRQYFGGGTVAAVVAQGNDPFHAKRNVTPHEHLEDGTLPFHSIFALDAAIAVHERLYGGFANICSHTTALARYMHKRLSSFEHYNQQPACAIYSESYLHADSEIPSHQWAMHQGPLITFNLRRPDGAWVGYSEVEKLAAVKQIHIRTGGLCNPGGIETYIGMSPLEIRQNYEAGHRCWDDKDVIRGKPTGAVRVSLGAMSTLEDVRIFLGFIEEFYVEKEKPALDKLPRQGDWGGNASAIVESIIIYPIKSCAGFKIPVGISWEVKPHGFAWDREWCLVHLGTKTAMSQKAYTKMALIKPTVDLEKGILNVTYPGLDSNINIPLSPTGNDTLQSSSSRVCGDKITALTYSAPEIVDFFSNAIGVPCTLARFPASLASQRHFKPHLQNEDAGLDTLSCTLKKPQILLSNESPILVINRASVDHVNELIAGVGGKAASADVYRANLIVSQIKGRTSGSLAYSEDGWKRLQIGRETFELLGPCRRCHMVCIDQTTAQKNEEPYVTLSKTRTVGGRVLFGQHATHVPVEGRAGAGIKVGDLVRVWAREEEGMGSEGS
ncbi:pyridoxal phosphate-dependent transferase [Peziza echinospora]|nr:pyridoxal phosphate-dependent transferase [Peziza echinospora]